MKSKIKLDVTIPRYTKEEYKAIKDTIPVDTVFIIVDDNNKEDDSNVTEGKN